MHKTSWKIDLWWFQSHWSTPSIEILPQRLFRSIIPSKKWIDNSRKSQKLFTSRGKGEFGIVTHSYHARTARECQCGCFCGADSIFGILDFARPTISRYPWEKSRMLWSLMSILNINVLFYAFKSARNRFFSSFYIRADPMIFFWAPSEILDGGSQNLTKCKDTTPPAISNDTIIWGFKSPVRRFPC